VPRVHALFVGLLKEATRVFGGNLGGLEKKIYERVWGSAFMCLKLVDVSKRGIIGGVLKTEAGGRGETKIVCVLKENSGRVTVNSSL